jgi:SAM-dependent methyltransferase
MLSEKIKMCPVCKSKSITFIHELEGQRTRKKINLFQCLDCKSLFNPSGYKENDAIWLAAVLFFITHYNSTVEQGIQIIKELKSHNPTAKDFLDIGAGMGTLMNIAHNSNLNPEGVEPNPFAVLYAKRNFSLDIKCAYFDSSLCFDKKFDLITIVDVFEHLEEPRLLFKEAIKCLNKNGVIFVRIPCYIPEIHEKFLQDPNLEGTIFFYNDVHIVHFSKGDFIKLAEEFKATFVQEALYGFLLKFD